MKRRSSGVGLLTFLLMVVMLFGLTGAAFGEGPAALPRTGQTTCYDTFGAVISCAGTGQDGDIQAGVAWPSPRFTDNGDNTAIDNLTGLMWSKDANLPAATKTWQQSLDYVAGMNAGTYTNYGHTDWRLPNVNELASLIDSTNQGPALPTGHPFINVQPGNYYYWSSTTYAGNSFSAWTVSIWNGEFIAQSGKAQSSAYVLWPVRSYGDGVVLLPKTGQTTSYATGDDGDLEVGLAWPSPRFTDHGDSTITDNLTGHMWSMDANLPVNTQLWQQAIDYVAGMNAGTYSNFGYTDWRLPNKNELRSIFDYGQSATALPSNNPFVSVQNIYWTSTTNQGVTGEALHMWPQDASLNSNTKTTFNHSVWPVRGGSIWIPTPPNTAPTLAYSSEAGYSGVDGVNPDSGTTANTFTYKVVYTDADDDAPTSIDVYIDASPYAMTADTGCGALCDGDYTNGEQYVYTTALSAASHNYYFDASDGTDTARLPASGTLSGPSVSVVTNSPVLSYSSDAGYGGVDGVDPASGTTATTFTYKVVYTDANDDAPTSIDVYIDASPYAMTADTGCGALCDGDYTNGEQYVYATTLSAASHNYYFYASDGSDTDRLPAAGTLGGPTVGVFSAPPTLSYSSEAGFNGADGVAPNSGDTSTTFVYKALYTDSDDDAPTSIEACIDATCYAMALDTVAAAYLRDGDYTNGEQYVYTTILSAGSHTYYFDASGGADPARLPAGILSGPSVSVSNTTPALSYSIDVGYNGSDGVDPETGTSADTFTYKVVYTDADNDAPTSMNVYIDTVAYAMTADTGCGTPALCDGNYTNGEQYVHATTLALGSHNYYFAASDDLVTSRLPTFGTLSGPSVSSTGNAPTLTFSLEPGYSGTDGVNPGSGDTATIFTYKAVYTDIDNNAPTSILVFINGHPDGVTMTLDTGAAASLNDGDYTNGEQYLYSTLRKAGVHSYYFYASDGTSIGELPVTLTFLGPTITGNANQTPTGAGVSVTPGAHATVTFSNVTGLGSTTVANGRSGSRPPAGYKPVDNAYYDISTTTTFTGAVDIHIVYDNNQFAGSEGALRLFHMEGGSWVDVTASRNMTHNIIRGRVTSFSEFVLASEGETLINLSSFTATDVEGGVRLDWATASEIDNAGFNLWKKAGDGEYALINGSLIPANGSPTSGASYSYTDYSVEDDTTYYYRLEDIDASGKSTFHDITGIHSSVVGSTGAGGAQAGKCFIATAAYGSYLDPHVKVLRDFRDTYLLTNGPGRLFVGLYYTYSPPMADFIAGHSVLRSITRVLLLPLIAFGAFMVKASVAGKVIVTLLILAAFIGMRASMKRRKV